MLYIYRPRVSEGARLLEDALNDSGVPTRFTQGRLLRERFRPDRDRVDPLDGNQYRDGRVAQRG